MNIVYQLDEKLWFPHPETEFLEEDTGEISFWGDNDLSLIAIGGDLSVERLLLAYDHGIFPWFPFRNNQIQWSCPRQRFVIFPNEIHVSHSMRTLMNKHIYHVTFNTAFDKVIKGCSTIDKRIEDECAWLGEDMIAAFTKLHELGRAQSVEVWRADKLVGGLYGVVCGNGFVGESMFSLEPSTSKLALIALARRMQEQGGSLIDCQIRTPHLESMGGRYISYKEYITLLFGDGAYYDSQEMQYLVNDTNDIPSFIYLVGW